MALSSVWTQEVFTNLVKRRVEDAANANDGQYNREYYGQNIAPMVSVRARKTKMKFADMVATGLGQFKAPNATPALMTVRPTLEEKIIDLALLEEDHRIESEEWLALQSNDPLVRDGERVSLLDRMHVLQTRNDKLTEWMRWEAFKGTLVIAYPNGSSRTVDYGIQNTHKPTAATAWTDLVNADPIENINTWAEIGASDAGSLYTHWHMNFKTLRLMLRNENVLGYLTSYGRELRLATTEDLTRLLAHGAGEFHTIDAGYRAENATGYGLTKFLPDNRVLGTTDYNYGGMPIADVADGQVLVNVQGSDVPVVKQGMQSEFFTDWHSKNVFVRQASARIPRINFPDAFLYATVGA